MGLEYNCVIDYSGGSDYFKATYRGVHNCYKCNAILSLEKYEKIVYHNSKSKNWIRGTKYIWDVFYCPNCREHIDLATQLTYEDINIFISKVKRKFSKKGITLQVRKYFETKEGKLVDRINNIEEILKLCLLFWKDNKMILNYKKLIIKKEFCQVPYYYFKFSKRQIMKNLKTKLKNKN